jgi:hypothetical protein
MKKSDVMVAINTKVNETNYNAWRIGLTQNLEERKKYWEETEKQDISCWWDWETDSLSDAQEIEAYFIKKGMMGGTGGDLSEDKTTFVYIF